jgi:hypothetical protein
MMTSYLFNFIFKDQIASGPIVEVRGGCRIGDEDAGRPLVVS